MLSHNQIELLQFNMIWDLFLTVVLKKIVFFFYLCFAHHGQPIAIQFRMTAANSCHLAVSVRLFHSLYQQKLTIYVEKDMNFYEIRCKINFE